VLKLVETFAYLYTLRMLARALWKQSLHITGLVGGPLKA